MPGQHRTRQCLERTDAREQIWRVGHSCRRTVRCRSIDTRTDIIDQSHRKTNPASRRNARRDHHITSVGLGRCDCQYTALFNCAVLSRGPHQLGDAIRPHAYQDAVKPESRHCAVIFTMDHAIGVLSCGTLPSSIDTIPTFYDISSRGRHHEHGSSMSSRGSQV
jgi:hypothetical protein